VNIDFVHNIFDTFRGSKIITRNTETSIWLSNDLGHLSASFSSAYRTVSRIFV